MSADFDTDLARRLSDLDRTTSRIPLRDADAIRRRGRQRAHRQTAGAVAAALAVVGIGVATVTGPSDRAAEPVPVGPVPSTTADPVTPAPAASWSLDQPLEGTLPLDRLPPVGSYGDSEPWGDGSGALEQWQDRAACGEVTAVAGVRASTATAATSLDAVLRQQVLGFDDAQSARAAYESWQQACAAASAVTTTPVTGGPVVAATAEAVDQEYDGALSSAVWLGSNVVVVVDVVGNIAPADLDVLDDGVAQTAALLAEQVATALGGGSPGTP